MKKSKCSVSPLLAVLAAMITVGCSDGGGQSPERVHSGCARLTEEERTSVCSVPVRAPEYYVEQSHRYFDSLDSTIPPDVRPEYAERVVRWEWPPWLKLTGFGRDSMIFTDLFLKLIPTRIPVRDCRFFPVQPFGRCYVVFDYSGDPCPIYEEFTFNEAGEMTFIEAWTDAPGFLPMLDPADRWGEGPDVNRLSSRIPGLGSPKGRIDLDGEPMQEAASRSKDVADFVTRAKDPVVWWLIEAVKAGPDLFEHGCHPDEPHPRPVFP
jgi:hypothetical protein